MGASLTGLLAIIAGAWGAVAGYIGPYFGWHPVAQATWAGTLQNGLLHLAPGAVAAAAGLMLLAVGPARRSAHGGALFLPGVMLLAAGAWFVIGPIAWPTFETSLPFMTAASATRNLLNVACASYIPGLVIVMLAGIALKAAATPRLPVADRMIDARDGDRRGVMADEVAADRAATGRTATGPVAEDRAMADRAAEGRMADGRMADGRMVDGRMVDGRMVEDQPMGERPVSTAGGDPLTPDSASGGRFSRDQATTDSEGGRLMPDPAAPRSTMSADAPESTEPTGTYRTIPGEDAPRQ
ncbi:MAG TPA: hypothetical protein VG435_01955 [Acidimicrobiales bacterium]|nr:hypothetical protein [Acidimicrobiales bacterium]